METALEISEQAKVLSQLVQSSLDRLRSTDELHYSGGISLLTVKNDLLLSYIHHLVIIQLIKVTGHNLADHAPVISETIKSRVALEKVRPLEGKLKYQIEKLLRKAEVAAEGKDTAEELANDPLSFRPNPDALMSTARSRHTSVSGSEEESNHLQGSSSANGIYRPPRLAAMPYTETKGQSKKDKREKPETSALLTELATSLNDRTPFAETTSGLAVTTAASNRKQRKLDEMTTYEEENMTRLSMSKRDAKRRLHDEEEVALGGGGSLDTRNIRGRRGQGGFGGEFDELLNVIEKGGQKRSGVLGRVGGSEYEALRQMRSERKDVPAEEGRQKKRPYSSGRFEAALSRSRSGKKSKKR